MSSYVFKSGDVEIAVTADNENDAWEAMIQIKNEIEVNYSVTLPYMCNFKLHSAA